MRTRLCLMVATFLAIFLMLELMTPAPAQPGGKKGDKQKAESAAEFGNRLMAFNKAKDGKLTKEELTDPRLHNLFDRADANKNGVVTREELEALFARESTGDAGGFGLFGGGDGPKGKGPDGKKDKGKGKGGFPQPGQILAPIFQDGLNLTDAQRKQLADLQKDVDARLDSILTNEQKSKLQEMRTFGGFGPPPGDKKGPLPGGK